MESQSRLKSVSCLFTPLGEGGRHRGTAAAADELVRCHSEIEILVNNLGIFEPMPFESTC